MIVSNGAGREQTIIREKSITHMTSNKGTIAQILPAMHSGGVERGVVELSIKLAKSGYKPLVISNGSKMTNLLEKNNIKHIKLAVDSKNPLRYIAILKLRNIFANIKLISPMSALERQ